MAATFRVRGEPLGDIIDKLEGADGLLDDIADSLAEETVNLVREGFGKATDPYGSAWKATKKGNKPLHGRSGNLRTAWSARAGGGRFGVKSGVGYSVFHQDGAPRAGIDPRKMVPDDGDIPPKWEKRFDEVTEEILEQHFES